MGGKSKVRGNNCQFLLESRLDSAGKSSNLN